MMKPPSTFAFNFNCVRPFTTGPCGHAPTYPVATFVMQYFRRPKIVNQLLNSLKTISLPIEIIVNDDSRSEIAEITKHSKVSGGRTVSSTTQPRTLFGQFNHHSTPHFVMFHHTN